MALAILPLLLLGAMRFELPKPCKRMGLFFGDISYAIYAVHWPLTAAFITFAAKLNWSRPVGTAIYLAMLVTIGAGLHHCFDVPMRRWLSKRRSGPHG